MIYGHFLGCRSHCQHCQDWFCQIDELVRTKSDILLWLLVVSLKNEEYSAIMYLWLTGDSLHYLDIRFEEDHH